MTNDFWLIRTGSINIQKDKSDEGWAGLNNAFWQGMNQDGDGYPYMEDGYYLIAGGDKDLYFKTSKIELY